MVQVTPEDVRVRLAVPFEAGDADRVQVLIDDAVRKIRRAFARRGRDFDAEVEGTPWLGDAAFDVVLEMVTSAIVLGPNAGVRSASSTTGPQSDSITYSDPGRIAFSGVKLLDDMLVELGLAVGVPRGRFPRPVRWPERVVDHDAARRW